MEKINFASKLGNTFNSQENGGLGHQKHEVVQHSFMPEKYFGVIIWFGLWSDIMKEKYLSNLSIEEWIRRNNKPTRNSYMFWLVLVNIRSLNR